LNAVLLLTRVSFNRAGFWAWSAMLQAIRQDSKKI
jgi:hypothetical protein